MQMVDGIHSFLLAETDRRAAERSKLWNRDYTSADQYERSIASNRQRFRQMIGAVDERVARKRPSW